MPKDYSFEDEDNMNLMSPDTTEIEEETWDEGEDDVVVTPADDDEDDDKIALGIDDEEEEI